jgi:alpha-tubulin suppressor-like RCC1 family protein
MPNYSGKWNLAGQLQGIKAGTWTGILTSELYAWGTNTAGAIGFNDTVNRSSPVQVSETVYNEVNAGSYNGGLIHSAAIRTDGTLWTWGSANAGQTGHNDTVARSSPTQVGALTNWAAIEPCFNGFVALKTDGTLWSWGTPVPDGTSGIIKSSPVQIGSDTDWATISGGNGHRGAIKTGGELYLWGNDGYGVLGQNTTNVHMSSPVQVGALTNWAFLACGNSFNLVVKTDGTLWAWGIGFRGALGKGDEVARSSPVQVGSLTTWSQASASEYQYSSAAIKTDGTLWRWGENNAGQLGDNTIVNKSSPVQIGSDTDWTAIAVADELALGVRSPGELYSWGLNADGQLGQNDAIARSSPVQVGSATNWYKINVAGNKFAIATRRTQT